ncbi:lysosomal-trafficking regulator-like isoform X2 [Anneissia japonica]|uniref:lysosomal-trafficking regulator-like isoform X2 n=1 Tax=Anneissia japonica TaxID=1529436 RepID=UPI00142559BC|nr:lysosomal-trafficking regulator-like isoform X2 [Anneissia japonica]
MTFTRYLDRMEKQLCLEDFLHLFLVMSSNKAIDSDDITNFCTDIPSAFNIMTREFMSDIQELATKAQASDGEVDENGYTILMQYLIQGRGWLILSTLHNLAAQALSCINVELGNLLITLLQETLRVPLRHKDHDASYWVPHVSCSFPQQKGVPQRLLSSIHQGGHPRKYQPSMSTGWQHGTRVGRLHSEKKYDSTDSEGETKPRRIRYGPLRERQSYFLQSLNRRRKSSVVRTAYEVDPQSALVLTEENDAFDLFLVLLALLEKLCANELLSNTNRTSLSFVLVPQMMEILSFLKEFHFEERKSVEALELGKGWDEDEILPTLQRLILRVLLKLCHTVGSNLDGATRISSTKTLTSLMQIAKHIMKVIDGSKPFETIYEDASGDSQCMSDDDSEIFTDAQQHLSKTDSKNTSITFNFLYLSEILQGILELITSLLRNSTTNHTVITHVNVLLQEFESQSGFDLLSEVIKDLDGCLVIGVDKDGQIKEMLRGLIKGLSAMITALKRSKLEYMHKMQCLKRTHRQCDYSKYMHHHHNIYGMSCAIYQEQLQHENNLQTLKSDFTTTETHQTQPLSSNLKCCVSRVTETLLQLFRQSQYKLVLAGILFAIENSGICCCMTPEQIILPLLENLPKQSAQLRPYILSIIGKLILEQLGGSEKHDNFNLDMCAECQERRRKVCSSISELKNPEAFGSSDSAISSDGSLPEDDTIFSKWNFIHMYRRFLTHKDKALGIQVARHLYHLIKRGDFSLKQSLYRKVYLPCFELHSKQGQDVVDDSELISAEVLEHCFCALPPLLTTTSAQSLFLYQGGLNQLLYLLKLENTRPYVLRVFEVLILSEHAAQRGDDESGAQSRQIVSERTAQEEKFSQFTSSFSESLSIQSVESNNVIEAFVDVLLNVIPKDDEVLKSLEELFESEKGHTSSPSNINSKSSSCSSSKTMTPIPVIENGSPGTYSENVVLCRSKSRLEQAAGIWRSAKYLLTHSSGFQDEFLQCRGPWTSRFLLQESLTALVKISEDLDGSVNSNAAEVDNSRFNIILDLFCSTLSICLSSASIYNINTMDLSLTSIIQRVKQTLAEYGNLHSAIGKSIIECILSTSLLLNLDPNRFHNSRICNLSKQKDRSGTFNWEDLYDVSDSTSDQGESWITEGGYEADSERDHNDLSAGDATKSREDYHRYGRQRELLYPQVCRMVLELLAKEENPECQDVLCFALNQLIYIAKACDSNRIKLYMDGLGGTIMRYFTWILERKDKTIQVVQDLLLELFAVLVQPYMSADELRQLLHLFQTSSPPIDSLLNTLLEVTGRISTQPSHILCFPVHTPPLEETPSATSTPNPSAYKLPEDHYQFPSPDPWSLAPLRLPLQNQLNWPPIGKGFGLTMWMRVEEKEGREKPAPKLLRSRRSFRSATGKTNSKVQPTYKPTVYHSGGNFEEGSSIRKMLLLHIVSMGNSDGLVQLWVDPKSSSFVFRASETRQNQSKQLAEKVIEVKINPSQWHHISLSYVEKYDGLKVAGHILLIIDGHDQYETLLKYEVSSPGSPSPANTCCLLGHLLQGSEATPGLWQMGNVLIFNDSHLMNKETCFHLFTMGPDYYTLAACEGSKQPAMYNRHISEDVLKSGISHDLLTEDREMDLRNLRESFLAAFSPCDGEIFSCYTSSSQAVKPFTRILSAGGLKPASNALLKTPVPMEVNRLCAIESHVYRDMQTAVHELGGTSVFLYLFARVVEKSSDRQVQAKALKVLFQLLKGSQSLASDFRSISGPALLGKVLMSSSCIVGFQVLKILLDSCCSDSILTYCSLTNQYKVNKNSHAVIKSNHLLVYLILAWKLWETSEEGVWETLYHAVEVLIREDHRHRSFNIAQLQSLNIVDKLLMIIREQHNDSTTVFPGAVCFSIVNLIKAIMGSPPETHLIAEVCDFLLAVHPAIQTFICHAKSSYYFTLHTSVSQDLQATHSQPSPHYHLYSDTSNSPVTSTPNRPKFQLSRSVSDPDNVSNPYPGSNSDVPATPPTETKDSLPDMVKVGLCQATSLEDEERRTNGLQVDIDVTDASTVDKDQILQQDEEDFCIIRSPDSVSLTSSEDQNDEKTTANNRANSSYDTLDASCMKELQLALLCSGLLKLLFSAIVSMPDASRQKIIGIIIKPDLLLVLAHHAHDDVRVNIVKLLEVFFLRADEPQLEAFLKMRGFNLLANQLHQYPATRELLEACLTITYGKPVDLSQSYNPMDLQDIDHFHQLSLIPCLALLENCVHEPPLCHNALCLLLHLFEGVNPLAVVMLENGINETLCNVLTALCTKPLALGVCSDDLKLLITDVQHFMTCIIIRACSQSIQQNMDYFDDLMTLLSGIEQEHCSNYGEQSYPVEVFHETQCYIVREVLGHMQATSCQQEAVVSHLWKSNFIRSISYSGFNTAEINPRENLRKSLSFKLAKDMPAMEPLVQNKGKPKSQLPLTEDQRYSVYLDTMLRLQRNEEAKDQKKHTSQPVASEQDITKRFQHLCKLGVNLTIMKDPKLILPKSPAADTVLWSSTKNQLDSYQDLLLNELYSLLVNSLISTMEQKRGKRSQWESVLWSSRDTLRLQLSRLFIHMLSPQQPLHARVLSLQIAPKKRAKDILEYVFQHQFSSFLHLFLYDLLSKYGSFLNPEEQKNALLVQKMMIDLGFEHIPPETEDKSILDEVHQKMIRAKSEIKVVKKKYAKQKLTTMRSRKIPKQEIILKEVYNSAMDVTQRISSYQHTLRKKLYDHLRHMITHALDARTGWQDIIQQLAHERAVWYTPDCYPTSWQLDPTEGPGRVRCRLQRCHLGISKEFILENSRKKSNTLPGSPLEYLFQDVIHSSDADELKRKLQENEQIRHTCPCLNVTPASETKGEILLGLNTMYFVGDEPIMDPNITQVVLGDREVMTLLWLYEDIKEILPRWNQLRDNAMEVFLVNGKTFLLSFESQKERDEVIQKILAKDLPNLIAVDDISLITQIWRNGQITNYEYLTQLNKIAGRSFNDLMQYPVFPFILRDYSSVVIDLESPNVYRDLSRPISVQTDAMASRFIEQYKLLEEEFLKQERNEVEGNLIGSFHYGSHYSNSGTTLQYLVRVPPFTKMFLQYQDNHFDIPDRTFHSIETAWRLSSFQSASDVKELIPEFFFFPEFLVNKEGFDFGLRQNGELVDDVTLPIWCQGSPRLFILIHRQALESSFVSQTINGWVDLVFGYKQKGESAKEAINVFHPATYFGIDTTKIEDPLKRRALETMIKTYGQTPKQLFRQPHPQRFEPEKLSEAAGIVGLAHMATRKMGGKNITPPPPENTQSPLNSVKGIRWGGYVGSPAVAEPVVRWSVAHPIPAQHLIPLPTGSVCGVSANQCLLVMYSKEKGVSGVHAVDIKWSGIASWEHSDGILRLKHKPKVPPVNLIHSNKNDKITCCSSVTDCRLLLTGSASGIITAYNTKYNPDKQASIEIVGSKVCLYGHTDVVSSIVVSRPFSIMVTTSFDGTCIVWDLNRLCYVQSLSDHSGAVTTSAISNTLGDIATVAVQESGSCSLHLWNINGNPIGRIICEMSVLCVAFSDAPEGISVNCLAAGCSDGLIRLWSTWDFSFVRSISSASSNPVISLCYTVDSRYLFSCDSQGQVSVWGRADETKNKVPKFEAFMGPITKI